MESPADVVVHAAVGHRIERLDRHIAVLGRAGPVVRSEEQVESRRLWELRSAAPEAAVLAVGGADGLFGRASEQFRAGGVVRLGRGFQFALDGVRPLFAPVFHLLRVLLPRVFDVFEEVDEPRPPLLGALREVRPDVERFPVRRQPRRQRPPAAAGDLLADTHVDCVDVRAFLPVHLYRDEVLVQ
ncbi:hypothetical protein BG842_22200 [Haladaptatus sp. W1]|nr:hypothetical protein BG842_22200 [Haladaptatus sp. W1]